MPVTSRRRRLPVLATAATTAVLLTASADAASRPPDVWQASTVANRVGADLAGHFDADRMWVTDCARTAPATRTCDVEVLKFSEEDNNSDCTWRVAVTRTRRGLRHRTGKARCQEDGSFDKPTLRRALRRSKARAYRLASRVAVARARGVRADATYVGGCDTHHSSDRVCQIAVYHGGAGGGAVCQSLVIVPPLRSRRPVRAMALGPCTAQ